MTRILSVTIVGLVCLAAFSGCAKKSSTASSGTASNMSAMVNGNTFNASYCGITGGQPYYTISANNGSATIAISIRGSNFGASSFIIDSTGVNSVASYTVSGKVKIANEGSCIITAVNTGVSVTGTFGFTLSDGTAITAGKFTAAF